MENQVILFSRKEKPSSISNRIDWKLVVYLFFVLFSPPILPNLNILIPITLLSVVSLYRNYSQTLFVVLKRSIIYNFIKLYILCYGIVFIMMYTNTVLNGEFYLMNFVTNIYRLFFLMGCQLICILYLFVRAEILGYQLIDMIKVFLYALLLQVGIGLLAFFIPAVKSTLLTIMERNTGSDVYYREGLFSYGYTYRYNGFAGTLLDTFGYGMGLASGIFATLGFYKNKKYLVWAIILFIPSILNSRTGILIAVLGLAISFLSTLFVSSPRKLFKQTAGLFVIFIIVAIVFYITAINSPSTVGWIIDGFESIFNLLTGQEVRAFSTADQLFQDDFWTLPSSLFGIVFGEGFRVYGMSEILGFASDVGYVNHIWLSGIIGMILMYMPFMYLFLSVIIHNKEPYVKTIGVFLIIAFFIFLIKGDMVGYNTGMLINLFIPFVLTYNYSTETTKMN